MDVQSMQIQQNQTCSHKILPTDCTICQTEAFLSDDNGRGNTLPRDVKQLLSERFRKSSGKVYTFDYYFAKLEDLAFQDQFVEHYPNLCHGLIPLDSDYKDGKKIRIVFIGEEEACMGFLFGLLHKYGELTMTPDGLDIGFPPLQDKMEKNYATTFTPCIFGAQSAFSYCITFEGEEGPVNLGTTNIKQCFSGFKKMMEFRISDVYGRDVAGYFAQKKAKDHDKICNICSGIDGDEYEGFENLTLENLPECKAYWYFIE